MHNEVLEARVYRVRDRVCVAKFRYEPACDRPQGLNRGAVEQFVLLGAWSPVACVEDAVGGVDLFRGKVLHVTRTALVAHSAQSDEQAVVEEPENWLPRSRGDHHRLHRRRYVVNGVEILSGSVEAVCCGNDRVRR